MLLSIPRGRTTIPRGVLIQRHNNTRSITTITTLRRGKQHHRGVISPEFGNSGLASLFRGIEFVSARNRLQNFLCTPSRTEDDSENRLFSNVRSDLANLKFLDGGEEVIADGRGLCIGAFDGFEIVRLSHVVKSFSGDLTIVSISRRADRGNLGVRREGHQLLTENPEIEQRSDRSIDLFVYRSLIPGSNKTEWKTREPVPFRSINNHHLLAKLCYT